ncbi:hypothetical protein HPB48_011364 [Haemaphysalis longicornis]|uniref:Uncharacterized protein n=1 Tax=Haemaphysalis longicornis TaxID=44386 RepID=A0A9J6FZ06_HAELO|nr:hypothetical protein HPB48_011364 [Haemaphysalis longicornis]
MRHTVRFCISELPAAAFFRHVRLSQKSAEQSYQLSHKEQADTVFLPRPQEACGGVLMTVRQSMTTRPDRLVRDKQEGLDKALREKYAYIDTRRGLRAALHDRHAKTIEVSSGHLGTTIMSLAMHKGCFYRDAFSTASRRLVESGHFLKWESEDQPLWPKEKRNSFKTIELSDVFSHGTILIAGYSFALLALAAELARHRYAAKRAAPRGNIQQHGRPLEDAWTMPKATVSVARPRRTLRTRLPRRVGKKTSSVSAVAPLPPVSRSRSWETRIIGRAGFKRVSVNVGPHMFRAGDLASPGSGGASGGRQTVAVVRRHGGQALPAPPPISTT